MNRLLRIAGITTAVAFCPAAHAAVMVTTLPAPLEIREEFSGRYDQVDVDNDGAIDFTFGSEFSFVGLRTEKSNRAIITLDPLPNIGGPPYQISPGSIIGVTLPSSGSVYPIWASSDSLEGFVSPGENLFMGIVQVLSTGSNSSFNGRGAIGIEFHAADGIHYGYIDISAGRGYAGITFYGWAWETEPGKAILAGQVPEPSYSILFVMSLFTLLAKRKRQ